jgi:hypothetical protein
MAQSTRRSVLSIVLVEYGLVHAFHNYPAGQPNTDRRLLHVSGEHPHLHIRTLKHTQRLGNNSVQFLINRLFGGTRGFASKRRPVALI